MVKKKLSLYTRISTLLYNIYSPFYDKLENFFAKSFINANDYKIRTNLIERLNLFDDSMVLEIAVGTGGNIPLITEYTSNYIFGIDLSTGMLQQCIKKIKKYNWKLELILGNAEALPFKNDKFDSVLNFGGMAYFNTQKDALNEMFNVIKPGGKVVISEQITFFEKVTRKDKPPVHLIPDKAKNISYEYIFNKNFYVIEFSK